MYCMVFLGHLKKGQSKGQKAKADSLDQSGLKRANFLEFSTKKGKIGSPVLRSRANEQFPEMKTY